MKKLIKNNLFCFFVAILLIGLLSLSVNFNNFNCRADGERIKDVFHYVSLGDSIAAGYGLGGYDEDEELNGDIFVSNSYSARIKNYLNNELDYIDAKSYGCSGDTVSDLLNKLNTNQSIIEAVQSADLITISIGANDILEPASNAIVAGMVMSNMNFATVESSMQGGLDSLNSENGLVVLLDKLKELNSDGKVVFLDVYNPYKHFIEIDDGDYSITYGAFSVGLSAEDLRQVGLSSQTYIMGGENLSGDVVVGLNEILFNKIYLKNSDNERIYPNFYMIGAGSEYSSLNGIAKCFNDYDETGDYSDLVNAGIYNTNEVEIDPHPTTIGHEQMFLCLKNLINNKFLCLQVDYVDRQYNGFDVEIFIRDFDETIFDIEEFESKHNGEQVIGIYTGSSLINEWSGVVTKKQNGFTKESIYLKLNTQFVVTYITGSEVELDPLNVLIGSYISEPRNIRRDDYVLLYWGYYDGDQLIKWNFNEDVISGNLVLYAVWTTISCLDEGACQQYLSLEAEIKGLNAVRFTLTERAENLQWYVNGRVVEGQTDLVFAYTPPALTGKYEVSCVVNGRETGKKAVYINYTDQNIITINKQSEYLNGEVSLVVEHPELYDGNYVQWFRIDYDEDGKLKEESVAIGKGVQLNYEFEATCKVYAVYSFNTSKQLTSNTLDVSVVLKLDVGMPIFIGIGLAVFITIVILAIISKKRYQLVE